MNSALRDCIGEITGAVDAGATDPTTLSPAWAASLVRGLGAGDLAEDMRAPFAACALGWLNARVADGQMHTWEDALRCAHEMASGEGETFTDSPGQDFDLAAYLFSGIFDEAERREYGRVVATSRLG